MDQRTDWQSALTKQFHNSAPDPAYAASGACNKDGVLDWHMIIPP
jgi:hypothetical protein